ncbi:hypothetical protein ABEU95_02085 [Heyndrickxia faecalis]|uniref:YxiG family protein n=1 Tax=Heyndrickxia faecalis TaxID=2824910 RepID=UPI003D1B44D0
MGKLIQDGVIPTLEKIRQIIHVDAKSGAKFCTLRETKKLSNLIYHIKESDNMKNRLFDLLNEMWAAIIESYEFDILKNTISFELKTIDNGYENKYKVVFEGVTAWYFVENTGEERLNIKADVEEGDYLELTSIDFYMGGIGEIKPSSIKEDWVNQYYSNANFALEIWDALLLIEAKSIIINGNKYPVT